MGVDSDARHLEATGQGLTFTATERMLIVRRAHNWSEQRPMSERSNPQQRPPKPQQQGDGQPENQKELEDPHGGSAEADRQAAEQGPGANENPESGDPGDPNRR